MAGRIKWAKRGIRASSPLPSDRKVSSTHALLLTLRICPASSLATQTRHWAVVLPAGECIAHVMVGVTCPHSPASGLSPWGSTTESLDSVKQNRVFIQGASHYFSSTSAPLANQHLNASSLHAVVRITRSRRDENESSVTNSHVDLNQHHHSIPLME